jgi:hypothetical protein
MVDNSMGGGGGGEGEKGGTFPQGRSQAPDNTGLGLGRDIQFFC